MGEATIKSMAAELAKGLKTPKDLNQITAAFKKFMIETAVNTELSDLGLLPASFHSVEQISPLLAPV